MVLDRRSFLRAAGAAGATLAATPLLGAGCSPRAASPRERPLRIGYVTPSSGALAEFAAADSFVIGGIRRAVSRGIDRPSGRQQLDILVRDAASSARGAIAAAESLIRNDRVDLMLTAQSPEITNPVAQLCETRGVPCISSLAPWQPWFFGRGGTARRGFEWTYHFFFGLDEFMAMCLDIWSQADTNKVVGALWPADDDGRAFRDVKTGFPPNLRQAGYRLIDPGPYAVLNTDFAPIIEQFKRENVEILTGVPLPADFNRFWRQAADLGFRPRIASVGKALLFPSSVEALGPLADGLTVEVWWSPFHPFNSSLTGQSAKQLADAYTKATDRPWTQPIGFVHALFEVAIDVLARADDVADRASIRDAIGSTNLDTIVGPIAWDGRPVRNVTTTSLVGGQWGLTPEGEHEVVIVTNKGFPQIPVQGQLRLLSA